MKGGKIFFLEGEAAGLANVFTDTTIDPDEIPLDPTARETGPFQARSIVRALHEVITDNRLPESQREEATNQLMHIALTGLRASQEAEQGFQRYQQAVSITSAL